MKKILALKIVDVYPVAKPKIGGLVSAKIDIDLHKEQVKSGDLFVCENPWIGTDQYKEVLPYGISDVEPKIGDRLLEYHLLSPTTIITVEEDDLERCIRNYKHNSAFVLEMLPEQFNYEEIVQEKMKDGDLFIVEERPFISDNESFTERVISKHALTQVEEPKTYTEAEMFQLTLDAVNLGMNLRQDQLRGYSDKSGNEVHQEWFLKNK